MHATVKVSKSTVAKLVQLTFPSYSGRKFRVALRGEVTFSDVHWGGGTRSMYRAVRFTDGATATLLAGASPWSSPSEGRTVEIPTDVAIVEHAIFCGRDAGITVHVNPECSLGRQLLGTATRAPLTRVVWRGLRAPDAPSNASGAIGHGGTPSDPDSIELRGP